MHDPALRPLPPDPLLAENKTTANQPRWSGAPFSAAQYATQPAPSSNRIDQPPARVRTTMPLTDLKVYGHSALVYWWPMWMIGYVMAGLSFWQGRQYQIASYPVWFHPSSNLGICFFVALITVILITNVSVRGLASGLVILTTGFVTVRFAYLGWWDSIFSWLGGLKIHLNHGAYSWFSTLLLIVWAASVFVFDRMTYWHFKPGQVTQEYVFGAGSKCYDTNGMLLEKHREDLFRHWILGLGSGDLKISTTGAIKEQIEVSNVLLIGSKIELMQRLIAEETHA